MIRRFAIKYITPIVWKLYPERKIAALQEFSTIERDSGCQILWSLELIKDPKNKAILFQHVLEEFFHGEVFEDVSQNMLSTYATKAISNREILVNRKSSEEDVWDFFSYAHVGEEGVNRDFMYYAEADIDKKVAAVFSRVSADEANHIHSTEDILREMTKKKPFRFQYLIVKSGLKRKIKQMESAGRFVGDALLTLVLGSVYFIFGYFIHKNLRERFLRINKDEVLALLKEQQEDL